MALPVSASTRHHRGLRNSCGRWHYKVQAHTEPGRGKSPTCLLVTNGHPRPGLSPQCASYLLGVKAGERGFVFFSRMKMATSQSGFEEWMRYLWVPVISTGETSVIKTLRARPSETDNPMLYEFRTCWVNNATALWLVQTVDLLPSVFQAA